MFRERSIRAAAPLTAGLILLAAVVSAPAQERRPASRIDVEQYTIDAEISPNTQSLDAKAAVRFVPLDDNVTSAVFELNNALNVSQGGGWRRQADSRLAQPAGFLGPPELRPAAAERPARDPDLLL